VAADRVGAVLDLRQLVIALMLISGAVMVYRQLG
jgi:hypothetical protein